MIVHMAVALVASAGLRNAKFPENQPAKFERDFTGVRNVRVNQIENDSLVLFGRLEACLAKKRPFALCVA